MGGFRCVEGSNAVVMYSGMDVKQSGNQRDTVHQDYLMNEFKEA